MPSPSPSGGLIPPNASCCCATKLATSTSTPWPQTTRRARRRSPCDCPEPAPSCASNFCLPSAASSCPKPVAGPCFSPSQPATAAAKSSSTWPDIFCAAPRAADSPVPPLNATAASRLARHPGRRIRPPHDRCHPPPSTCPSGQRHPGCRSHRRPRHRRHHPRSAGPPTQRPTARPQPLSESVLPPRRPPPQLPCPSLPSLPRQPQAPSSGRNRRPSLRDDYEAALWRGPAARRHQPRYAHRLPVRSDHPQRRRRALDERFWANTANQQTVLVHLVGPGESPVAIVPGMILTINGVTPPPNAPQSASPTTTSTSPDRLLPRSPLPRRANPIEAQLGRYLRSYRSGLRSFTPPTRGQLGRGPLRRPSPASPDGVATITSWSVTVCPSSRTARLSVSR